MGDLMLGDSAICVGFGFASRHAPDGLEGALEGTAPQLSEGDVVFGNLETVLSLHDLRPRVWRSAQMRGHPHFARALATAGFRVLNVANNHAMQHGPAAFAETVDLLRAHGIACCGLRGTQPWAAEPAVVTVAGVRLGFLGYCLRPRQYGGGTPPFAEGPHDAMLADVARLRPTVDHVMVSLHWGEEFVTSPSQAEVIVAHELCDAGASVILGHHPHVVRPVEHRGGDVIAYSLGNFIADQVWHRSLRRGLVLSVSLEADGAVASASVRDTALDGSYRPTWAGGETAAPRAAVVGLDAEAYAAEALAGVRAVRWAKYRYALRNAWRYKPRLAAQLVTVTMRNRIASLRKRIGRESVR